MASSDIRYRQTLDNSQFKKGLKETQGLAGQLKSSLLAIGPAMAAAFSIGAIVNFGKAAVKAWDDQEKANVKLLTALKGNEDVTRRLLKQSVELSKTTLFADEQIVEGQAMLAMLTKDEAVIKRLMPLVADLAQAKGMGLAEAAQLVAKSIGTSTNALKRQGIEIEGAVGSQERLESAVRSLTSAFGGQAEAAANTGAAGLQQLGKAWGELLESFGSGAGRMSGVIQWLTDFVYMLGNAFKTVEQIKKESRDDSVISAMAGDAEEVKVISASLQKAGMEMSKADLRAKELLAMQLVKLTGYYGDDAAKVEELWLRINELRKEEEKLIVTNDELGESLAAKPRAEAIPKMGGQAGTPSSVGGMSLFPDEMVSRDTENMQTWSKAYEDFYVDVEQVSESLNATLANMAMAVVDAFGQMIEAMVAGEKFDFGASLLGAIGGFMNQLGMAMISIGVIGELFDKAIKSMQWYLALGAGIALVAAGAVLSGVAKKGVGMETGGIVPAGFPNDSYPAMLTSGETVIPAPHKLNGLGNGMQVVVLDTRVSGNDIWLSQKKTDSKMSRYR